MTSTTPIRIREGEEGQLVVMGRRDGAAFTFHTRSTVSAPTRRRTGAGNGSFRKNAAGSISRRRNQVAIISTNLWYKKPSGVP